MEKPSPLRHLDTVYLGHELEVPSVFAPAILLYHTENELHKFKAYKKSLTVACGCSSFSICEQEWSLWQLKKHKNDISCLSSSQNCMTYVSIIKPQSISICIKVSHSNLQIILHNTASYQRFLSSSSSFPSAKTLFRSDFSSPVGAILICQNFECACFMTYEQSRVR